MMQIYTEGRPHDRLDRGAANMVFLEFIPS